MQAGTDKRFVRILVVDGDARLLVVRQRHGAGNVHCFPGGKVELRERPRNAASRELREEVGVRRSASLLLRLFECPFQFGADIWRGSYYITAASCRERILPREYPKVDRATFFSLEQLRGLPGDGPSFLDIAEQYRPLILDFARQVHGGYRCSPISNSRGRSGTAARLKSKQSALFQPVFTD